MYKALRTADQWRGKCVNRLMRASPVRKKGGKDQSRSDRGALFRSRRSGRLVVRSANAEPGNRGEFRQYPHHGSAGLIRLHDRVSVSVLAEAEVITQNMVEQKRMVTLADYTHLLAARYQWGSVIRTDGQGLVKPATRSAHVLPD